MTRRRPVKGMRLIGGDIIEVFADLWPAAFVEPRARRPLKVGIDRDILAVADGAITPEELRVALCAYTAAKAYLKALREGAPRIGLDASTGRSVPAQQTPSTRDGCWSGGSPRNRRGCGREAWQPNASGIRHTPPSCCRTRIS